MTSVPHGSKKDRGTREESTHRERGKRDRRKKEEKERGSRGAFLRDVAFAGHHAYVTLREGHVRAYNTIRGVIPPSPLGHLFSFTVAAVVPVVVNFVPRSSFAVPSAFSQSIFQTHPLSIVTHLLQRDICLTQIMKIFSFFAFCLHILYIFFFFLYNFITKVGFACNSRRV